MKTVCIDFDGVIHKYTSPWNGAAVITDPPVEGAFDAILRYQSAGYSVAIFSTRNTSPEGCDAIIEWLKKHGLQHDVVSKLSFPSEKPQAVLYIDDRGYCFTGQFPSVEFIAEFLPWNKKP